MFPSRVRFPLRSLLAVPVLLLATVAHGQIREGFVPTPIPVPRDSATKDNPLVLTYNVFSNGNAVKKTVTITDLPKKQKGETDAQAMERKANTIVAAINEVLGKDKAVVVPEEQAVPKNYKGRVVKGRPWVVIKGLAVGTDARGRPIESAGVPKDGTRQAGNGGRIEVGSGGQFSLGGTIRNEDQVDYAATGFGPDGEPSLVEFGVDGFYVASITPDAGMSDLSILSLLSADLAANGIPNTFDTAARSVTIDPRYSTEEYSIYSTSTDPGLPFGVAIFAVPVPEPGTWMLIVAGLGVIVVRSRRSVES